MLCGILFNVLFIFRLLYLMCYCIIERHEVQDSQINIIIAIKHSKHISIAIKVSVSLPGGPDPTSSVAACFLVPDVDARGNTVTHGFILFPAVGSYVQQGGMRGHCIILHRRCL